MAHIASDFRLRPGHEREGTKLSLPGTKLLTRGTGSSLVGSSLAGSLLGPGPLTRYHPVKRHEWGPACLPGRDHGPLASPWVEPSMLVWPWVMPGPGLAIGTMKEGERRHSDSNTGFGEFYLDNPLLRLAGWLKRGHKGEHHKPPNQ